MSGFLRNYARNMRRRPFSLYARYAGLVWQTFFLAKYLIFSHHTPSIMIAGASGYLFFIFAAWRKKPAYLRIGLSILSLGLIVYGIQAGGFASGFYMNLLFDPILSIALTQANQFLTLLYGLAMVVLNESVAGDQGNTIGLFVMIAMLLIFTYLFRQIRKERDKYYHASITDSLTQTYNFAYTLAYGQQLLEQAERPIRVLLLDIDSFKAINDRYGHLAGNQIIVVLSGILRRHAAKLNGFLGRLGGDEFVMILEDSGQTALLGSELQREIKETRFAAGGGIDLNLTVSIGEAVSGSETADFQALFHLADMDMFSQKQKARYSAPGCQEGRS